MSFCATIQEPPTATTEGSKRYSFAFSTDIPPVGMKLIPGKGADIAFKAETPPKVSAGKNLRVEIPALIACNISVGVETPGKYGIPCLSASTATDGENPAETARQRLLSEPTQMQLGSPRNGLARILAHSIWFKTMEKEN